MSSEKDIPILRVAENAPTLGPAIENLSEKCSDGFVLSLFEMVFASMRGVLELEPDYLSVI